VVCFGPHNATKLRHFLTPMYTQNWMQLDAQLASHQSSTLTEQTDDDPSAMEDGITIDEEAFELLI
jgi:hypothetical protein